MLETMIRRDRNHPCMIIWSMANESKTDNEVGIKVMRALIRRTKELDRTRLVTFVTAPGSVRSTGLMKTPTSWRPTCTSARYRAAGRPSRPVRRAGAQADRRASAQAARRLSGQAVLDHRVRGHGLSWHARRCRRRPRISRPTTFTPSGTASPACHDVSGGVLWSWADYYHRRHSSRSAHSEPSEPSRSTASPRRP